jgi:hypothetical protein
MFVELEIEFGIIRSLCLRVHDAKLYYGIIVKSLDKRGSHVKLHETLQILWSAGSSKRKGVSPVWKDQSVGNQVSEVSSADSAWLGEMQ